MSGKRKRRAPSLKRELITKSREAALSAVQTFNNPLIQFKSEAFIVLMIIAWTYLLHAYYREKGIDYRYFEQGPKRKIYDRTKRGAYKYWELERCLNDVACPLDQDTKNNLLFLIGLRHEIEHQMTLNLDSYLSGRYQACCLNYNESIKHLFGNEFGIEKHLTYSLQFVEISHEQASGIPVKEDVPARLTAYIAEFDGALDHNSFNSPKYSYRLLFKRKVVGKPGQADKVVEFIDPKSELAQTIDKEYWVKKEVERQKFVPSQIVKLMRDEGYSKFSMHYHTELWKAEDAKKPGKGLGVTVANAWYWYEPWVEIVRKHCVAHASKYRVPTSAVNN